MQNEESAPTNPLDIGNRMPLPAKLHDRNHFFYTAKANINLQDVETLSKAALREIESCGVASCEIGLLGTSWLSPEADHAFHCLCVDMGLPNAKPSILYCSQAIAHVDDAFEGKALVSLVLHAGNEGYAVQTAEPIPWPVLRAMRNNPRSSSNPERSVDRLLSDGLCISTGDVLVMDPTTVHSAHPVSQDGDLLILLQFELPDETQDQRQAIVRMFEPIAMETAGRSYKGLFF